MTNKIKKNGRIWYLEKKNQIISFLPVPNQDGQRSTEMLLKYLIRTIPQDEPYYYEMVGFTSYCIANNGLTDRQYKVFIKWINYWTDKGIL